MPAPAIHLRIATSADRAAIESLIQSSVRSLQPEYTERQREAALRTVFTPDSMLIADGTYFVATAEGVLVGCGGWSFRSTRYGGDHQIEVRNSGRLDPAHDAARIRAIFVHPDSARQGIGRLLLRTAESAAAASGFRRFEMGSTLAGLELYTRDGYVEIDRHHVPVGEGETILIVHMEKTLHVENAGKSAAEQ